MGEELILFKFGARMFIRRNNRPIILLSMGVAMATMHAVILAFHNDKENIPQLISVNVNSSGEHLYRNELATLEGDGYQNYWVSTHLEYYETLSKLTLVSDGIYYIVGNDEFMKETIIFLNSKGIENSDIIFYRKEEKLSEYF